MAPNLETHFWAAQSGAVWARVPARCHVGRRSGLATRGIHGFPWRPENVQKLKHRTAKAECPGRQWKANHQPEEQRQAHREEKQNHTEPGKHIVHDE